MTLTREALKVLQCIPESNSVGGKSLCVQSGLDPTVFRRALSELVQVGEVAIGVGRGGSIRRIRDERRQFLAQLPSDGQLLTNRRVREALAWDEARYWDVHAQLVADGIVVVGRGQGGSVGLVVPDEHDAEVEAPDDVQRPVPPENESAKENEWYPILLYALRHEWAKQFGETAVEITAYQGKKSTGGTWSRPDLTAATLRRYRLLPSATFDVWTFEVKRPADWSIVGVHEASAHGRRSTRPVLLLVAPAELEPWQTDALASCIAEAARLGVGLVVAAPPYHFENWTWHVEPERHEPAPHLLEEFLEQQLPFETREVIALWWAAARAQHEG